MTIRFAERLSRLGTESAFEVLARARRLEAEGRSIVHLEIGEPDFATPDNIIDAAVRAMRGGATHYTAASGIREVREKTSAYITRHTGVPTTYENIVLVPGSKNLLLFALWSLVEEGDEVIVPDPGYPIYRSLVEFIGAKAVSLPLRQENDFRADVSLLRDLVTPRTKMIVVNSPQNPTGGILTQEDCEEIARIAMEHDLIVLSDEIYNRLTYDAKHVSLYGIPGMAERTIYMDGLSKAWAMCGWRLGVGSMPVEIAKRMDTLMINSSSCAAAFTQWAAVEAFDSPESDAAVDRMVAEFAHRRDRDRRPSQRDPRGELQEAGRGLLRLSRHHRDRLERARARELTARRGRGRRPRRHVVRAGGGRAHQAELRGVDRQPRGGGTADRTAPGHGDGDRVKLPWRAGDERTGSQPRGDTAPPH